MTKVGIRRFVDALQHSGLAPVDVLRDALTRCRDRTGKPLSDSQQLADFLVAEGIITPWHREKLLTGKYKGFVVGDWILQRHIGTGGMSTVYLARHRTDGRHCAIKVLPRKRVTERSYLQRFRHEAEATRRLNHPNIVKAYEFGEDHGTFYFVMEFVEGKDLAETVKRDGPLDFVVAVRLAAQTARALHYAHRQRLIHRDIKPGNLLIDVRGNVKLLDLGLAMSSEDKTSLTRMYNERVIGTADYLSPEQAVDSHRIDHRSDVYSLGCTLYFMLTGHAPFPSGSLAERIASHQATEPKDIRASRPNCPVDLIGIVRRMMTKRVEDRYQDAEQVARALEQWLAARGLSVDAATETPAAGIEQRDVAKKPRGERRSSRSEPTAAGSDATRTRTETKAPTVVADEGSTETRAERKSGSRRTASNDAPSNDAPSNDAPSNDARPNVAKPQIAKPKSNGSGSGSDLSAANGRSGSSSDALAERSDAPAFEPVPLAPLPDDASAASIAVDSIDPMAPALKGPGEGRRAAVEPPAPATRWIAGASVEIVPLDVKRATATGRDSQRESKRSALLNDWRVWLLIAVGFFAMLLLVLMLVVIAL